MGEVTVACQTALVERLRQGTVRAFACLLGLCLLRASIPQTTTRRPLRHLDCSELRLETCPSPVGAAALSPVSHRRRRHGGVDSVEQVVARAEHRRRGARRRRSRGHWAAWIQQQASPARHRTQQQASPARRRTQQQASAAWRRTQQQAPVAADAAAWTQHRQAESGASDACCGTEGSKGQMAKRHKRLFSSQNGYGPMPVQHGQSVIFGSGRPRVPQNERGPGRLWNAETKIGKLQKLANYIRTTSGAKFGNQQNL